MPKLEKIDNKLYKILLEKSFGKIQSNYFAKDTKFFGELYTEFHMEYYYETMAYNKLKGQDIIFFDPDTGIEMPSKKMSERYKYVSYRILSQYWNKNKSLIIFQHKDHQSDTLKSKKKKLFECLKCEDKSFLIVNSKKVYYLCIINDIHNKIINNIKYFCIKNKDLGYNLI
jgi:hypothetical protein